MKLDRRCTICSFKFQQAPGPGKKAVNCPMCRKDRQDKWKRDKADGKTTQKSGKDKGK